MMTSKGVQNRTQKTVKKLYRPKPFFNQHQQKFGKRMSRPDWQSDSGQPQNYVYEHESRSLLAKHHQFSDFRPFANAE
jgi:hypothetical protein